MKHLKCETKDRHCMTRKTQSVQASPSVSYSNSEYYQTVLRTTVTPLEVYLLAPTIQLHRCDAAECHCFLTDGPFLMLTTLFAVSKYTKEWQGISRPPPFPPDPTADDSKGKSPPKLTAPGHCVPQFARPPARLQHRCMLPRPYPSTSSSADPRFAAHSPQTPASNHPKPRWSKPRCASVSPLPPPPHIPRPYGMTPEKPPGRNT